MFLFRNLYKAIVGPADAGTKVRASFAICLLLPLFENIRKLYAAVAVWVLEYDNWILDIPRRPLSHP